MNIKISIILIALGFSLTLLFPFQSHALTALIYFSPLFVYVLFIKMFPPYIATLSTEDKAIINSEKWKSILRSVYQVVGTLVALTAFGVKIPYIDIVKDMLVFIMGEFDAVVAAVQLLIGFGLTIFGFFKNDERFQARLTTGKRLK